MTTSDASGRFEFTELAIGEYRLSAAKAPFLTEEYGSTKWHAVGSPIRIREGQHPSLTVRMRHASAIGGIITDEHGRGLAGVRVMAVQAFSTAMPEVLDDVTGADGSYRVSGLRPGDYAVVVEPSAELAAGAVQPSAAEVDDVLRLLAERVGNRLGSRPIQGEERGYLRTYYPGTPIEAMAEGLSLESGQERTGVSFAFVPSRTVAISGSVDAIGLPVTGVSVECIRTGAARFSFGVRDVKLPAAMALRDGRASFSCSGLVPGSYLVAARSTLSGSPSSSGDATSGWAMRDLGTVTDTLSGVSLRISPSIKVSGRVRVETSEPTVLPGQITLSLAPAEGAPNPWTFAPAPASVGKDGRFSFTGIPPGQYVLRASVSGPDEWRLTAAMHGRIDWFGHPIVLDGETGDIVDVAVTLTNRATRLSGTVSGLDDTAGYTVLVAGVTPASWYPGSRRLASSRVAADGSFLIEGLPEGEYYLSLARELPPQVWQQPRFLEESIPTSVRVRVSMAHPTVQDLLVPSP